MYYDTLVFTMNLGFRCHYNWNYSIQDWNIIQQRFAFQLFWMYKWEAAKRNVRT